MDACPSYSGHTRDAFEAEFPLCAGGLGPGSLHARPRQNHLVYGGVELSPKTSQGGDVAKEGGNSALQFWKTIETAAEETKEINLSCQTRHNLYTTS